MGNSTKHIKTYLKKLGIILRNSIIKIDFKVKFKPKLKKHKLL